MDVMLLVLVCLVGIAGGAAVAVAVAQGRRSDRHDSHGAADSLMEERVARLTDTLGERVDGMSNALGERVAGMSGKFDNGLSTMGRELRQLRDLVNVLQAERAEQYGKIDARLSENQKTQSLLDESTRLLREALASPGARGQWGERMAEDVLRAAGMQEGIQYLKQSTLESGKRPDFTFLLPKDGKLHMDVKFPAQNYLAYLEADSTAEAERLCRQFLNDVRKHVKSLHKRGYAAGNSDLDCVLLFIANESIYGFIHANDPDLFDDALAHKIVLCSPTTLYMTLGVIRHAMDTFALEQRTSEILDCLASVEQEWRRCSGQIATVHKQLGTLNNSVAELEGPRRRAMARRIAEMHSIEAADASLIDGAVPAAVAATAVGAAVGQDAADWRHNGSASSSKETGRGASGVNGESGSSAHSSTGLGRDPNTGTPTEDGSVCSSAQAESAEAGAALRL